jgi:hypothetical protein
MYDNLSAVSEIALMERNMFTFHTRARVDDDIFVDGNTAFSNLTPLLTFLLLFHHPGRETPF